MLLNVRKVVHLAHAPTKGKGEEQMMTRVLEWRQVKGVRECGAIQCLSVAWSIAGVCKRVSATLAAGPGYLSVSSEPTCLSVNFSSTSTLIVPTTLCFCACVLVQMLLVFLRAIRRPVRVNVFYKFYPS